MGAVTIGWPAMQGKQPQAATRGREGNRQMDRMGTHATAETSAIVLAGVYRWDDSAFDELLSRPLMPVAHTPLICHVLGWLRSADITHVTACANSESRQMRHLLGDGSALGIDLDYYEDWMPRGPAGCIRDAALQTDAERFVVADGTILPDCDLAALLCEHARSGAALTVVAAFDSEEANGNRERLVPTGIYVLERSVLEHVPETGYQDIKEVLLPRLHARDVRVRVHTLPAPCPRLTDAASYIALNACALERLSRTDRLPPGYRRAGQSIVHESAHIAAPDRLAGDVLIGPGTMVAPSATVIGPVVIGAECVIEAAAVVGQSVVWDNCRIVRGAAVSHCVLGDGAEVEAEALLRHAVFAGEPDRHPERRSGLRPESAFFPSSPESEEWARPDEKHVSTDNRTVAAAGG
jgi:NDP-sugar pyrophosphorylase family protein